MPELWFGFVVLALTAYAVLDGFDLGAGTLHLLVAKNEEERGRVLRSIGPFWDGNEVWLIASGGTLLMAFPHALAVAFSGFYLALFLVLWGLMLRGVSIELRGHLASPLWRSFWDVIFFLASASLALLFGVALGNVLRGVPLGDEDYFTLPLFASREMPVGLLDVYTTLVGLTAVVVLAEHGATFLIWKNEGPVRERARTWLPRLQFASALFMIATFVASLRLLHLAPRGLAIAAVALSALSKAWSFVQSRRDDARADRLAFLGSCGAIAFALIAIGIERFPVILPAIGEARSIDARDALSSSAALGGAVPWYVVALVLIVIYFANLFRVHRGKVAG
jgi:cytochrome bd ubiquinol oxidase subunit II